MRNHIFAISGVLSICPSAADNSGLKDLTEEVDLTDTCESCLAKGGGWCTAEQRCVEDDTAFCDADSLIGLAGFTNDCQADEEAQKPKSRPKIDKGDLVSYTFENGTCCLGTGLVHRAYHVLEEYTVLSRDGSKEEVKTERWNNRKPAKKKDEGSEYHDIEFRYFKAEELRLLSSLRAGDVVQAHFEVKQKKGAITQDGPVKSKRAELATVVNVTASTIAVNYAADNITSIVPRDFVIDATGEEFRVEAPAAHEEL